MNIGSNIVHIIASARQSVKHPIKWISSHDVVQNHLHDNLKQTVNKDSRNVPTIGWVGKGFLFCVSNYVKYIKNLLLNLTCCIYADVYKSLRVIALLELGNGLS